MPGIDLHTHSSASDGSLSPTELIEAAVAAKLSVLALTDHDTVDGLLDAARQAARLGLSFLNGVELSLSHANGSMHLLGYGFNSEHPALIALLADMQTRREQRNRLTIERLNELGIAVELDELLTLAGESEAASIGRPHIARLLIAKGAAKDFNDAFDRYLGTGRPAYVPKTNFAPEDGIAAIHAAGGLAVLAHPKYCGVKSSNDLEGLVNGLVVAGLDGIECHYTDHNRQETLRYLDLANRHGLLVTGGTDFHGEAKANARLGKLPDGSHIDIALYDALLARLPVA